MNESQATYSNLSHDQSDQINYDQLISQRKGNDGKKINNGRPFHEDFLVEVINIDEDDDLQLTENREEEILQMEAQQIKVNIEKQKELQFDYEFLKIKLQNLEEQIEQVRKNHKQNQKISTQQIEQNISHKENIIDLFRDTDINEDQLYQKTKEIEQKLEYSKLELKQKEKNVERLKLQLQSQDLYLKKCQFCNNLEQLLYIVPCGHSLCCEQCYTQQAYNITNCPIDQQIIFKLIKIKIKNN